MVGRMRVFADLQLATGFPAKYLRPGCCHRNTELKELNPLESPLPIPSPPAASNPLSWAPPPFPSLTIWNNPVLHKLGALKEDDVSGMGDAYPVVSTFPNPFSTRSKYPSIRVFLHRFQALPSLSFLGEEEGAGVQKTERENCHKIYMGLDKFFLIISPQVIIVLL